MSCCFSFDHVTEIPGPTRKVPPTKYIGAVDANEIAKNNKNQFNLGKDSHSKKTSNHHHHHNNNYDDDDADDNNYSSNEDDDMDGNALTTLTIK
jgi:hypothetical protein